MRLKELFGKRRIVVAAGVAVLLAAGIQPATKVAAADFPALLPDHLQSAERVGDETCLTCHDDYTETFPVSFHGMIEAFEVQEGLELGCESCHGPGSIHADSNDASDIINPVTAEAAASSSFCLACHRGGDRQQFESSGHAFSDVSCVSCHRIHGEQRRGLLSNEEPELCYACHQDTRARTYLPSHHPIREGKMRCTDCHEIHGDAYQNTLAGERSSDLCLSCHTRYQGPFVFEHDPVTEDCGICHDPHGSVANNLLKQNEPFICLQCHQPHFHSTLSGIEGEFTSLDGYTATSTRDGSKRGMLTKCTQCHSEVHGSDLPSQSISGQGSGLTR